MLTQNEHNYLATIPEDKKFILQEFDPVAKATAHEIVAKIQNAGIISDILNIGSVELGIAGQNDIDINILSSLETYLSELPILEQLFGPPRQKETLPILWEFKENGFDIEVYLTDASSKIFKNHLRVFNALKNNAVLRQQYEALKRTCNERSFRDYMKKKFEFFQEVQQFRKID